MSARDTWIPKVFVGGMLVVVLVNAGLVYAALSTFTGVTVERSYERGRGFNQVLAARDRQEALGWQAELRWQPGEAPGTGRLHLSLRDGEGAALNNVAVEGALVGPLDAVRLRLQLVQVGAGRYEAKVVAPRPGSWEVQLTLAARGSEAARTLLAERLVLP